MMIQDDTMNSGEVLAMDNDELTRCMFLTVKNMTRKRALKLAEDLNK